MFSRCSVFPHRFSRLVLLAALLACAHPAFSAPLSDATRLADPRLQKKVTLVASHILIGELVEKLSAQSGVALTVGEKDGAGDPEVLVSLKDVPLDKAMNALYALMSYQKAEWDWEKTGEGDTASYKLTRPVSARELAATLSAQAPQTSIYRSFEVLVSASQASRAGATSGEGDNPQLALENSTGTIILMRDLAIEAAAGDGSPIQSLTQNLAWPANTFVVTNTPGSVGTTLEEKAWFKQVAGLWLLRGDALTDGASARLSAPSARKIDTRHPMRDSLLQLSQSAPVPVMARLPAADSSAAWNDGSRRGKSVAECLRAMAEKSGLPSKWRDGVLLVSYNGWYADDKDDDARAPWVVIKRLRDAEANAPDHFLPLSEFIHAARVLTRPQMQKLADYFPVMARVTDFYDVFSLMAHSSSLPDALQSAAGTSRGDALTAAAGALNSSEKVTDGTARRVRMQVKDLLTQTPPMRHVMFSLLSGDGSVVARQEWSYPKDQFVTSAQR